MVLVFGAGLRFWEIGSIPPGLYQDEAYNGLDALRVIGGEYPLYFTANNGREPLYIYLVALSVSLFGRTPFGVRLPAAVLGTLTIPATFALGRALVGRRVGLMAAAVLAFTFWPLALSRVGFRAVGLPLGLALAASAAWQGFTRRRPWLLALGGMLYGLTFYTYLAARFTPFALIAFVLYSWISRRRSPASADGEPVTLPIGRASAWFLVPAMIVIAPLGLYALSQPDVVLARAEQVSIFSAAVNGGDLLGALMKQTASGVGMFFWRGDTIARHNLPGRPVFDPLMSVAFIAGVAVSAWAMLRPSRKRPGAGQAAPPTRHAAAFTLIWIGVMLMPTILAADPPHFLRSVGVLPIACVFPAVGLDAAIRWAEGRDRRAIGVTLSVLAIVLSLGLTARDYLGRYARDPNTGYLFQSAATELARSVNQAVAGKAAVFLDWRLWDNLPSLRFLIPENERLVILSGQARPSWPTSGQEAIYLWPYEDPRPVLAGIPSDKVIAPAVGPLARGDLEAQAYSLYSAYRVYPDIAGAGAPLAEFEGGFRLRSVRAVRTRAGLEAVLTWQATVAPGKDYQVFAQAIADGQILAQADGPLGLGLYPSSWWRDGEVIEERRSLRLAPGAENRAVLLSLGLYDPSTGARLRRVDAAGDSVDITP